MTPSHVVAPDIRKGVGLVLIATLGIVLMNTCAKLASPIHDPIEMVFYRGSIALVLLVPWMLATQPRSIFRTRRVKAHLYRALVGNLGVGFVFWAYSLLPMADATALTFTSPLFVATLSPLILHERMDRCRWGAVLVGFCGILLIARPSSGLAANPAALVGLAAGLCGALVDMVLRHLGRTDAPLTTVFYFLLIGVLVSGPYTFFFGTSPRPDMWPLFLGIGVFTAIQQMAKSTAYLYAEASQLAPCSYTAILWATLIGWMFWKEWPSLPVIAGAGLIIAGNLAIAWRRGCHAPPMAEK